MTDHLRRGDPVLVREPGVPPWAGLVVSVTPSSELYKFPARALVRKNDDLMAWVVPQEYCEKAGTD